ncbi:MAG: methionine gamma-lyase family protein, partial [Clostridia bacterium]|nr:methionine gamma-lyase family protein [Clostridia bacterium]
MFDIGVSKDIVELVENCEAELTDQFTVHGKIAQYNQYKVLQAFRKNNVALRHFAHSSGYGYEDESKLKLDKVYADAFNCEEAIVRPQIVSGTHCISIALFGLLRPGDTILSITGTPYETIQKTIGIKDAPGSLKEWGVLYKQIELEENQEIDISKMNSELANDTSITMVYVQRSGGYSNRKALEIASLKRAFEEIKKINEDIIIFVDNCYGEFVEKFEPSDVGADVIAGSLIKNPGGGIAPTGGYIAGRKDLVDKIYYRVTCPGIGGECGLTFGQTRTMMEGLFIAPRVTA